MLVKAHAMPLPAFAAALVAWSVADRTSFR